MAKISFLVTKRFLYLAYAGALLWLISENLAFLYLALLGIFALLDFIRLPRASQLMIKKKYPPHFALGRAGKIHTVITNASMHQIKGELFNTFPNSFSGINPTQTMELPPGKSFEIVDTAIPFKRGEFPLESLLIVCQGKLGLVRKSYSFFIKEKLKVYPEFKQLLKHALNVKFGEFSSDTNRNPFNTQDIGEFDSLRPYLPGESLRNIDWKMTAKRGQMIAKDWTEDLHKHLFLLIDCGQRMAEPIGHHNRLDHVLNATVQLCHAAAAQKDTLSVMAFSDRIDAVMHESEKQEMLPRLLETTYKLAPKTVESDYWQVFGQALLRLNKRSLIILFSDLLDMSDSAGILSNLAKAAHEHLVLCVVMTNSRIHQTATSTPTSESEWYAKGAASHMAIQRAIVLEKMKSVGVKVLEVETENFNLKVVESYLNLRKEV